METMRTSEIKTAEPFISMFPINAKTYSSIRADMGSRGYDPAFPIIVWEERGCVIDGHTRFKAANALGIADIPVELKSFSNEDEALQFAVHCQQDRRNLTEAEQIHWMEELDRRRKPGRPSGEELAQCCAHFVGKSANATAAALGVSARKVEQMRTVISNPEVKQQVLSGEISVNKAYQQVRAAKNNGSAGESGQAKGLLFCGMAIAQMERIGAGDPEAKKAWAKMRKWLDAHDPERRNK